MKLCPVCCYGCVVCPAAFRRLCVETVRTDGKMEAGIPAAFRRLCVETWILTLVITRFQNQPPSGGCVLKLFAVVVADDFSGPAAFRRLCVETSAG